VKIVRDNGELTHDWLAPTIRLAAASRDGDFELGRGPVEEVSLLRKILYRRLVRELLSQFTMKCGLAISQVWMDVKGTHLCHSSPSPLLDSLKTAATSCIAADSFLWIRLCLHNFPTQQPRHPSSSEDPPRDQGLEKNETREPSTFLCEACWNPSILLSW
jgi:hypothetical protein